MFAGAPAGKCTQHPSWGGGSCGNTGLMSERTKTQHVYQDLSKAACCLWTSISIFLISAWRQEPQPVIIRLSFTWETQRQHPNSRKILDKEQ